VGIEGVVAPEEFTLRGAECVSERVACQVSETGLRVLVYDAVLDPEAADLNEVTVGAVLFEVINWVTTVIFLVVSMVSSCRP
jgi:hypothetical protein